ncbi:MAG: DNA polymerase IV [Myxococcota bacterium]
MSDRPPPRIVCLDLDTFFVSVERLLDPTLLGVPVVVGASGWRGVVTSASYEVRALGVRSGMSIVEARRLAPDAVYLPTRHGVYGEYAARVKEVLFTGTDMVQTASIDEFFLDFRGCERVWSRPDDPDDDHTVLRRVWELRDTIQREVGLPASAGIASTRPLAKMASREAKPAGVFLVPAGGERAFVADQPVRAFPGIGPVTEAALTDAGIHTLGALLDLPLTPGRLRQRFAGLAATVRRAADPERVAALGRDRPAFHEHDPAGHTIGSISNERTFHADVGDRGAVDDQLRSLVERVCWRARRRGVEARTVTVKLRTSDFHTVSRGHSAPPTAADAALLPRARALLEAAWTRALPVRLVGVALSNLQPAAPQLTLPFGVPRGEAPARPGVSRAIDAVRDRFGYDAIRLGAVGSTSWIA